MSQPDFGSTFERGEDGDLTPSMRLLTTDLDKLRGWLRALVSRLLAVPGSLWYDPNYGFGLTNLVEDSEDPAVAAALINQCFKQDERCSNCVTTIVVSGSEWTISSQITAQSGEVFELVFKVTADKASLFTATQGQGS